MSKFLNVGTPVIYRDKNGTDGEAVVIRINVDTSCDLFVYTLAQVVRGVVVNVKGVAADTAARLPVGADAVDKRSIAVKT